MDQSNRHIPVWGGLRALLTGNVGLFMADRFGHLNPMAWFTRPPPMIGPNGVGLRQRVITSGLSTNGEMISTEPQDEYELPSLDDLGTEGADDGRTPNRPGPPPATTWDFSLRPFRFSIRALPFPIVGLVDLAVRLAEPVVYTVVSFVYQVLPLSSLARYARQVRILTKSPKYRHSPGPLSVRVSVCVECGASAYVPNRARGRYDWDGLRCEHALTSKKLLANQRRPIWAYLDEDHTLEDVLAIPELDRYPVIHPRGDARQTRQEVNNLFGTPIGGEDLGYSCVHPINQLNNPHSSYRMPQGTPDGLSYQPPKDRWRWDSRAAGMRCPICFEHTHHNWDPKLIATLKETIKDPRWVINRADTEIEGMKLVAHHVVRAALWCKRHLKPGWHYILQSITLNRVDSFVNDIRQNARVFLIDDIMVKYILISRYPVLKHPDTFWLVLPVVRSRISFAGWRLMFAMACPVDCIFQVANQEMISYRPTAAHLLKKANIPWSSLELGNAWPFFMGNALLDPKTSAIGVMEAIPAFYALGDLYGWDEIYPMLSQRITVLMHLSPGLPPILAPTISPLLGPGVQACFTAIDANGCIARQYVSDFTREIIWLVKQIFQDYLDTGNLTLAHAFFDPRIISDQTVHADYLELEWTDVDVNSERFRPTSLAGENVVAEIASSLGGVTYFTFGSRGDRNPVIANARWIASLGAKVTVVHLCSIAEGAKLLTGDDAYRTELFSRARNFLALWPTDNFIAPNNLFTLNGVRYDLAPPDDVIYPVSASDNVVVNVLFTLIGFMIEPHFKIGAFPGACVVPTSVDGKKFLEPRLNRGKKGSTGAWWGSADEVPPGYEFIERIPPGDHQEMFAEYETIYCHGGVGTVSLASACGARVVVVGSGLDRDYRNPFDAGHGFLPGQDPSNNFLALGNLHPGFYGVWLRNNWYNIPALWSWLGPTNLALNLFKFAMWYLFLSRVYRISMTSTTPMTTLVLLLWGRGRLTWGQYIFLAVVGKLIDKILTQLNKNYLWLFQKFCQWNIAMMKSGIAFYCAQTYGWVYGLLWVPVINILKVEMRSLGLWFGTAFQGIDYIPAEQRMYMEVTLRWHYIPVIHTALINLHENVRFEGVMNEFSLYEIREVHGFPEGGISLPTSLTLSEVRDAVGEARPYGLTWNCQIGLIRVLGRKAPRLGLGYTIVSSLGAIVGAGSALVAMGLSLCYGLLAVLPTTIGIKTQRSGLITIFGDLLLDLQSRVESGKRSMIEEVSDWVGGLFYFTGIA